MSEVAFLSPGKREQTKLANRLAILDAARAVFRELGFETATVRDIIRRTGLSVGAFYNYYRSKEEVIAALADDGARRFRPILHAEYLKATDFESYLRGAIRAYFEFIAAEAAALGKNDPHEPETYTRNTPEMLAVFEEVRTVFADVMDRGLAPKVDLDYLATACIAIAREVGDKMLRRQPVDVDAATEFCVRLILGGVAAAAPRVAAPDADMADPAIQHAALKGLLSLPRPALRLLSGGGVVYQGGRTLDPRFQFLAHQARALPQLASLTPQEARLASAQALKTMEGRAEPGVAIETPDPRDRGRAASPRAPIGPRARTRPRRSSSSPTWAAG